MQTGKVLSALAVSVSLCSCGAFKSTASAVNPMNWGLGSKQIEERRYGQFPSEVAIVVSRNRPAWLFGTKEVAVWKVSNGSPTRSVPVPVAPAELPRVQVALSTDERWVRLALLLPAPVTGTIKWRDAGNDGTREPRLLPGGSKAKTYPFTYLAYADFDTGKALTAKNAWPKDIQAGKFTLTQHLEHQQTINGTPATWVPLAPR